VTYSDLRPLFLDAQGKATNAMRQDGIHLSGKGEEVWLGALLPLIESLIGE
jgi:lysophospholipase L1-like esterase